MKSHKLLIGIALAFTVWYHLKKEAKAAPRKAQDGDSANMSSVQASRL